MAAIMLSLALSASSVNYTVDDQTIFPNPERGFITEFDHKVTTKSPYCVKGNENYLKQQFVDKDKISLILVLYYLDNYKNQATLPDVLLTAFDEDMQVLRDMGLKAILRFAYTQDATGEIGYDAPLDIVKSHIDQYKSHWEANADVIYVFQAGFVGTWGEWYYTSNFGNKESTMNESRRALLDYMLEAVPSNRCIQLRTPLFKTGYVGSTEPLTKAEAYQDNGKARLAHHNDAFLENDNNLGTYSDTATQKPYIAQETLYVPIGGESCILDSRVAEVNASYEATIGEMSRLHWTFIQGGYSQVVTDPWRQNGTFDELNRRLGYRYQLISGKFSDELNADGKLSVELKIRNTGFAPLYNERPAYIVLKNSSREYRLQLDSDPRSWLPNGVVTTINEQLALPSTIEEGTYQLYIYLPDASDKLAGDARFAIRFANDGVWDASTGMNSLNASVTIKTSGTACCDPLEPTMLPAKLDKSNVSSYSEDMTWYQTDYFDFGPTDAPNTTRWALWDIELQQQGNYYITEVMATAEGTGHGWLLELLQNDQVVNQYRAENTWNEGEIAYETPWDLTSTPIGVYQLRVRNDLEWGRPKLRSLSFTGDGQSTATVQTHINSNDDTLYDVLGRKVDKNYKGIVISNGRKWLQQ